MKIKELVDKYIKNVEQVLNDLNYFKISNQLNEDKVKYVIDLANRYQKDSDFYRKHGKNETALASIAYCEGLLDALRLLKVVEFEWPN